MLKKILGFLAIVLTMFGIIILEQTFLQTLNIGLVKANLFIIFFVLIISKTNNTISYVIAIMYGFIIDALYSPSLGITTFSLIITMLVVKTINSYFYQENNITFFLKVIIATIIFEVARIGIMLITSKTGIFNYIFLNTIFIETSFNFLIAVAIYKVIEKTGDILLGIYKESNVLTRYF